MRDSVPEGIVATSEALARRIRTAGELHSVVRTMKALSSVSIRQYEHAVAALGHYVHAIELGFRILMHEGRDGWRPEALAEPAGRVGVVVFGTDQGLCGPFNREVARHALTTLQPFVARGPDPRVACVGIRAATDLESSGLAVDAIERMPGSVEGIVGRVDDLLLRVDAWREEVGVARVLLVHNRPVGRTYRPSTTQLTPLDLGHLRALARRPWPTRVIPLHAGEARALLAALTREYTFAALFRAFAESLASEHAARLAAMQGAERAIEERIERLTLAFHQQRQAAITEELLDVAVAFEALEVADA
jgi:F-type H+-transporting ATPase subunit gamma